MKPAPFDYVRTESAAEACALLQEYGSDARILAGGQSLLAQMNLRQVRPHALIDLSRVAELHYVTVGQGLLRVGASVTQASLERRSTLISEVPLLAQALPFVAHAQIRCRGTLCGSLAHADPCAELPLCLVAVGGSLRLRSQRGERRLAAQDFLLGAHRTACQPDEVIVEACLPLADAAAGYAFDEVSFRASGQAIVAVAATVVAERMRVAIGGLLDRPLLLEWPHLSGTALEDALVEGVAALPVRDDLFASARYRRHVARHLGRAVIERAALNRAGRAP